MTLEEYISKPRSYEEKLQFWKEHSPVSFSSPKDGYIVMSYKKENGKIKTVKILV